MFIALALSIVACSNNVIVDEDSNPQSPTNKHKITLFAESCDEGTTRANFNSQGTIKWQAGDQIGVLTTDSYYFTPLTLDDSSVGQTKGKFVGELNSEIGVYAFAPYNSKHDKYNDYNLHYHFRDSYTYTSVGQDYYDNINSCNAALLGKIEKLTDGTYTTTFKHIGGVLAIKIAYLPSETGTIKLVADHGMTGRTGLYDSPINPTLENPEIRATSGYSEITIKYSGAEAGKPGVFYMPVCTGTYKIRLFIDDGEFTDGKHYSYASPVASINVTRGKLLRLNYSKITKYAYSLLASGRYIIPSVAEGMPAREMADMGMNGILWATTNVGAEKESDYGNYFKWGNATAITGDNYESEDRKFTETDTTTLTSAEDAATANWGKGYRMPTKAELDKLANISTKTWTTIDNHNGYVIKLSTNSRTSSIFLPAANYLDRSETMPGNNQDRGLYFSGTAGGEYPWEAYALSITKSACTTTGTNRNRACSVRPVLDIFE